MLDSRCMRWLLYQIKRTVAEASVDAVLLVRLFSHTIIGGRVWFFGRCFTMAMVRRMNQGAISLACSL